VFIQRHKLNRETRWHTTATELPIYFTQNNIQGAEGSDKVCKNTTDAEGGYKVHIVANWCT